MSIEMYDENWERTNSYATGVFIKIEDKWDRIRFKDFCDVENITSRGIKRRPGWYCYDRDTNRYYYIPEAVSRDFPKRGNIG